MNERQTEELLNLLSRVATAVEALAMAARPEFKPDHSRERKMNLEHNAALAREKGIAPR